MDISSRIAQLRDTMRLNQSEFALRIGVSDSTISNWETGKTTPGRNALLRIAERCGVGYAWLRTGEGEMHLPQSREGNYPTHREVKTSIAADAPVEYSARAQSPQHEEMPMVQVSPEVLAAMAAAGVVIFADSKTILSMMDRSARREPVRIRVTLDDPPADEPKQ